MSDDILKQVAGRRRGRHGKARIEADGHVFDSAPEYRRYQELHLLRVAGKILDLEVHPHIELEPEIRDHLGHKIPAITYCPDFRFREVVATPHGTCYRLVYEDVKAPARRAWHQTPTGKLGSHKVYDGATDAGYKLRVNLLRRKFPYADFREVRYE